MKVKKGKILTHQLLKALQKWYSQLLLIDPTCIIYGYDNEIPTEAIFKPRNIPNNFAMINFFSNINIKPNG